MHFHEILPCKIAPALPFSCTKVQHYQKKSFQRIGGNKRRENNWQSIGEHILKGIHLCIPFRLLTRTHVVPCKFQLGPKRLITGDEKICTWKLNVRVGKLMTLSDWLATLSAAYAVTVLLTRYTVGSIMLSLYDWLSTLSAAYAVTVWLACYTVCSTMLPLTDQLHCRQHDDTGWLAHFVVRAATSVAGARVLVFWRIQKGCLIRNYTLFILTSLSDFLVVLHVGKRTKNLPKMKILPTMKIVPKKLMRQSQPMMW